MTPGQHASALAGDPTAVDCQETHTAPSLNPMLCTKNDAGSRAGKS